MSIGRYALPRAGPAPRSHLEGRDRERRVILANVNQCEVERVPRLSLKHVVQPHRPLQRAATRKKNREKRRWTRPGGGESNFRGGMFIGETNQQKAGMPSQKNTVPRCQAPWYIFNSYPYEKQRADEYSAGLYDTTPPPPCSPTESQPTERIPPPCPLDSRYEHREKHNVPPRLTPWHACALRDQPKETEKQSPGPLYKCTHAISVIHAIHAIRVIRDKLHRSSVKITFAEGTKDLAFLRPYAYALQDY